MDMAVLNLRGFILVSCPKKVNVDQLLWLSIMAMSIRYSIGHPNLIAPPPDYADVHMVTRDEHHSEDKRMKLQLGELTVTDSSCSSSAQWQERTIGLLPGRAPAATWDSN